MDWNGTSSDSGSVKFGVAKTANLGLADKTQQIKIIETSKCFGKLTHQAFPEDAFRKIHSEHGGQAVDGVPGRRSTWHRNGNSKFLGRSQDRKRRWILWS
jgi:hypothetical protein